MQNICQTLTPYTFSFSSSFPFLFLPHIFLLGINQASYFVGKGFGKTFVIIGLDGIKCRWIVGG